MDTEGRQKNLFGFSGEEGRMFANMNNSNNGLISADTINNRMNSLAGLGPWEMAATIGYREEEQGYARQKKLDFFGNSESSFDNGKWY